MMRIANVLLIFVLIFSACKEKPAEGVGNLTIELKPKFGSNDLILNETISRSDGTAFKLGNLYVYLSNANVTGIDKSETLDDIILIDLKDDALNTYTKEIEAGDYTSLQFGLGVESEMNHTDPGTFDIDHPLGLSHSSNHWSWNSGYIFYKIEGLFDADSNGELDNVFLYHIGTDDFYRTVDLDKSFTINNGEETKISIEIDFEQIFYPSEEQIQAGAQSIDQTEETISHSTGSAYEIADKFVDNLLLNIE